MLLIINGRTLFNGDVCGPIAASMTESMFLLVISRWRSAFDGLKETKDYNFLSAASSILKSMECWKKTLLNIQNGRHILQEPTVDTFIPDDAKEVDDGRIHMITGPNYSGESIKQNILCNWKRTYDCRTIYIHD
ncbi:DNA mismatch repair protein MSH5 [Euphorbia peplus]|nr:DNA mismatch repair protein MSH5 [Euphorbia peplus]